jgi:hypothetical protein
MRLAYLLLGLGMLTLPITSTAEGELPIAHLMFRDYIVTIMSSDEGPLYTVVAKDGSSVATKIKDKALLSRYPDLHRNLKSAVADPGSNSFIWAGNSLPTPRDPAISVIEFSASE